MDLTPWIREVPDYPQPGVLFRDITPLLAHPPAFRYAVDALVEEVRQFEADAIGAIDARGFLFGAPAAFALAAAGDPVQEGRGSCRPKPSEWTSNSNTVPTGSS